MREDLRGGSLVSGSLSLARESITGSGLVSSPGCFGGVASDDEAASSLDTSGRETIVSDGDPLAIRCLHTVGCASKLRANKLSDFAERAGYFDDQIDITNPSLAAVRVEVDQITDHDMTSGAALHKGSLCLLGIGVVGRTLLVLVNDDALFMQWYLLV